MKYIKLAIILVIIIQILFVLVLLGTSYTQDVTLATERIQSFDEGWIFVNGEGLKHVLTVCLI